MSARENVQFLNFFLTSDDLLFVDISPFVVGSGGAEVES